MEEKRKKKERNAYRYLGRGDEKSALLFLDHTAKKTVRHPQFEGPHEYMFMNRDLHLGRKGGEGRWADRHTTAQRVTPEENNGCVFCWGWWLHWKPQQSFKSVRQSIKGQHTERATQAETWCFLSALGEWMIPGPRTLLCSGSVPSAQYPGENSLCIEDPRKTKVTFLSHPRDDGFKSTLRKWGYIFYFFELWTEIFTYQTR